ncbi:hypothetical protein IPL85_02215 [Candidatus Saccharibacteria bacterium]|nr:MAG: hypothetical protein IPL85_02215 [Candidatus Saccharibacteria bacterium]
MDKMNNGVSNRGSNELDQQVEDARREYRAAYATVFNRRVAHLTTSNGEITPEHRRAQLLNMHLDEAIGLENRILGLQQLQANTGRFSSLQNHIARKWSESGRFGKIVRVAIPAAALGLAGGLGVAALGVAWLGTLAGGVAAAYGGRKIGHGIAGAASRHYANTSAGETALSNRSQELYERFGGATVDAAQRGTFSDQTILVEGHTSEIVHRNQRRRAAAGAVGTLAASVGFGLGRWTGSNVIHHDAPVQSTYGDVYPNDQPGQGTNADKWWLDNSSANNSGAGGSASTLDTNQYPWQLAHGAAPGHEVDSIRQAMEAANQGGGHYNLHQVGNTLQVYDGNHALNAAQQAQFNEFMAKLFGWK